MYLQIGTNVKPLEGKVDSGFIVLQPIAKIVNFTIMQSVYHDTPEGAFTITPEVITPMTGTVTVNYFKSYTDYLAGERNFNFNTSNFLQVPTPVDIEPRNLPSHFHSITLTGNTISDVYYGLKNKLNVILTGITTTTVVVEE